MNACIGRTVVGRTGAGRRESRHRILASRPCGHNGKLGRGQFSGGAACQFASHTRAMNLDTHQNMLSLRACAAATSQSATRITKLCIPQRVLVLQQFALARQPGSILDRSRHASVSQPASGASNSSPRGIACAAHCRRTAPALSCSRAFSQQHQLYSSRRIMAMGAAASAAVAEEITPAPTLQNGDAAGGRRLKVKQQAAWRMQNNVVSVEHRTIN